MPGNLNNFFEELTNVGNWFSISALQGCACVCELMIRAVSNMLVSLRGKKAAALIKKYDVSGDGEIGPRDTHCL